MCISGGFLSGDVVGESMVDIAFIFLEEGQVGGAGGVTEQQGGKIFVEVFLLLTR